MKKPTNNKSESNMQQKRKGETSINRDKIFATKAKPKNFTNTLNTTEEMCKNQIRL